MLTIYNQSPAFGCVRVKAGGAEFVEKEGKEALQILETAQEACKSFGWHLSVDDSGYSLIHPSDSKEYVAPFVPKRRFSVNKLAILMKNKNGNTVSYSILCTCKEEVSKLYKEIRNSKGIEKMLKILRALETKNK